MMYPPQMVKPMKEELTSQGFNELLTPEDVDSALKDAPGTTLVVVNSICGCAAGGCRPGVLLSLQNGKKPSKLLTVFAGQDAAATDRARSYFVGYPPSSPSVALLKDGKIVHMVERRDIEGSSAQQIAAKLTAAYDKYC